MSKPVEYRIIKSSVYEGKYRILIVWGLGDTSYARFRGSYREAVAHCKSLDASVPRIKM